MGALATKRNSNSKTIVNKTKNLDATSSSYLKPKSDQKNLQNIFQQPHLVRSKSKWLSVLVPKCSNFPAAKNRNKDSLWLSSTILSATFFLYQQLSVKLFLPTLFTGQSCPASSILSHPYMLITL